MNIDPKECKIMLTEPPMNPLKNRQKMIEVGIVYFCKTKQDPVMKVFVSFVKKRKDETDLRFVSGHVRALRLRRRVRGHPGGPYALRSRPSHRLAVSTLGIWWICQILSVISTFAYQFREYT